MRLSLTLAQEYLKLYRDSSISQEYTLEIENVLRFVAESKDRIKTINLGIPWHVAAIVLVHDSGVQSLDWQWEIALESIISSSLLRDWTDWSLAGTLYALEGFYTNWIYQLRRKLPPDLWGGTNYPLIGSFVNGRWSETISPNRILGVVPVLKAIYQSELIPDVCEPDCQALLIGQGLTGTVKITRMSFLVRNKNLSPESQVVAHPVGTGNRFAVSSWKVETNCQSELFLSFVLDNPIGGFWEWNVKYSDCVLC